MKPVMKHETVEVLNDKLVPATHN